MRVCAAGLSVWFRPYVYLPCARMRSRVMCLVASVRVCIYVQLFVANLPPALAFGKRKTRDGSLNVVIIPPVHTWILVHAQFSTIAHRPSFVHYLMTQPGTGSDSQLELVQPSTVRHGQGYLLGPTVGQVSLQQMSPGMFGPGIRRSLYYGTEEEHSPRVSFTFNYVKLCS